MLRHGAGRGMADPILVLLIVLATGDDRPRSALVGGTAREAVGSETRILVEEPAAPPNDDEAARLSERLHASAVAEVRWDDPRHDRAHVHLYLADDHRWYDRDVSFEAADAPDERDRAVGFLVGAMVRAALPSPVPDPPSVVAVAAAPIAPGPPAENPTLVQPGARTVLFAADIAAEGAVGIAGEATAIGPSARAIASFHGPFGLQLGGALRFGEVQAAQASSRTVRIGAGGFWRALETRGPRGIEVRLSLDVLAVHHQVHRESPDLARERWVAGLLVGAAVGWHATSTLEPFVGAGVEGVFGPTPITVAEREVAEIPPLRATVTLGFRIHF
jgi:hypothetical protein